MSAPETSTYSRELSPESLVKTAYKMAIAMDFIDPFDDLSKEDIEYLEDKQRVLSDFWEWFIRDQDEIMQFKLRCTTEEVFCGHLADCSAVTIGTNECSCGGLQYAITRARSKQNALASELGGTEASLSKE